MFEQEKIAIEKAKFPALGFYFTLLYFRLKSGYWQRDILGL